MKYLITSLLIIFLISVSCQAQKNVEDNQFKINFINPGLEYEFGIAQNQTLDFSAGLQFVANSNGYAFIPALNGQYRYYYKFKRR